MIVVDASVLATALADDGQDGQRARARLAGERLSAPHLADVEVLSAWRRLAAAGHLSEHRAALARADLRALPVERVPHAPLLDRCWELRANMTVHDAAYVAPGRADRRASAHGRRQALDDARPCVRHRGVAVTGTLHVGGDPDPTRQCVRGAG